MAGGCVPTPGAGRGVSFLCTRRGRDDQHLGNSTQMAVHPTVPPEHHEASVMPSAENVFKEELLTVSNRNTAGFPARDAAVSDSIRRNFEHC